MKLEPNMEERRCMLTDGNLLEAHTWKGLLESSGICVELKGEALLGGAGELPVGVQNVELWVKISQYDLACQQLATLDSKGPQWVCVNCHEVNESSFELCWNCTSEKCAKKYP